MQGSHRQTGALFSYWHLENPTMVRPAAQDQAGGGDAALALPGSATDAAVPCLLSPGAAS